VHSGLGLRVPKASETAAAAANSFVFIGLLLSSSSRPPGRGSCRPTPTKSPSVSLSRRTACRRLGCQRELAAEKGIIVSLRTVERAVQAISAGVDGGGAGDGAVRDAARQADADRE
jgi:hypothetical protein